MNTSICPDGTEAKVSHKVPTSRATAKGTLPAFVVRLGFVVAVMIGSRMFLGGVIRARGRMDMVTSAAMMLLLILAIERFAPRILRGTLLLFAGGFLVFFHLLYGLYYRFYHSSIPFDVLRQWRDLFTVGRYGASLASWDELGVIVFLPLALLACVILKPHRFKAAVFIVLLAVVGVGWTNRLTRSVHRGMHASAALPDFVHKVGLFHFRLGTKKQAFSRIIEEIKTTVPRHLDGYRVVPGEGITVEPVAPAEPRKHQEYNVILILMESVRAYECGFLGAQPSFTPRLDELAKRARVYRNFYANGTQTVRAEISILCSVYPNPVGAPTYLVNPDVKLISLPQILCDIGYETLWFSGYTADFHRKRDFLSTHGVQKIYDRDVLPRPREPVIGWGMNDHEMFGHVWNIIKDANEPFFAEITTLSNHTAEADYPTENQTPRVSGSEPFRRYMHGTYYTDYAVSDFIEKVLGSELGKRTIIIATGDHGLWLFPEGVTDFLQRLDVFFRVPLCLWGPPELIEPGEDQTLGSHVDIAPTLMDMLGIRKTNTFLGQSLVDTDIQHDQRYVTAFLGNAPILRVGDVFVLSRAITHKEAELPTGYIKAQNMKLYNSGYAELLRATGDLLRGRRTIVAIDDEHMRRAYLKRLDDITLLSAYGVYFDAFKGIR